MTFLTVVTKHITKLCKEEELILAHGSGDTVYHHREGMATEPAPVDVSRSVKLLVHVSVEKEAEKTQVGSGAAYYSPL